MFGKIAGFLKEDKKYFVECKEHIDERNGRMLIKGCIIYACVLCFYTVLTIVTKQPGILATMYYVFDVIHICLCAAVFVSGRLKKRSDRLNMAFCACLEASLLSFFLLEGVFTDTTQHSLYIPIAILLVLLVFTHCVFYAYTLTFVYVLFYAVMSVIFKAPEAYINDLYIAAATLISACIGYYLVEHMRHSEGAAMIKYEKLSRTDQLTGILNKSSIMEVCEQLMTDPERACPLIIIDLDDFKGINDRYGHEVGDEVLKSVGREIGSAFRGTDSVGRFGGDEFIVIMDNCKDVEIVKSRVGSLQRSIRNLRFTVDGLRIQCTAGIALKHENDTPHSIFNRADSALYQAKKSKKGSYVIID